MKAKVASLLRIIVPVAVITMPFTLGKILFFLFPSSFVFWLFAILPQFTLYPLYSYYNAAGQKPFAPYEWGAMTIIWIFTIAAYIYISRKYSTPKALFTFLGCALLAVLMMHMLSIISGYKFLVMSL